MSLSSALNNTVSNSCIE